MSYINKIQKNNVNYDIQDARVPEVGSSDKDKVLHTNATTGALEWAQGGSGGGTSLYAHSYVIGYDDAETGESERLLVQFLDSSSTAYTTLSALMARIGEADNNGDIPFNTKAAMRCVRVGTVLYFDDVNNRIASDTNVSVPYSIVSYTTGEYTVKFPVISIDAESGDPVVEVPEHIVNTAAWSIEASNVQAI